MIATDSYVSQPFVVEGASPRRFGAPVRDPALAVLFASAKPFDSTFRRSWARRRLLACVTSGCWFGRAARCRRGLLQPRKLLVL